MLDVLAITGPIYVVIALGYAAVRARLFRADDLRALGKFVLHFALPALLFTALARSPVASIIDPAYLAAYAASGVGVMAKAARDEHFEEIADWFETLAKAERSHANRFQKALDALTD